MKKKKFEYRNYKWKYWENERNVWIGTCNSHGCGLTAQADSEQECIETMQEIIDAYLNDLNDDEINDKIDAWHESNDEGSLSEYLGMSEKEYAIFVEQKGKYE